MTARVQAVVRLEPRHLVRVDGYTPDGAFGTWSWRGSETLAGEIIAGRVAFEWEGLRALPNRVVSVGALIGTQDGRVVPYRLHLEVDLHFHRENT